MKSVASAVAVGMLAFGSASQAADDWAGPYVGVSLGMETFSSQFVDQDDEFDNQGVNGDSSLSFLPGVNAGWNVQSESFVYGVELAVDLHGADSQSKPYGVTSPALMKSELKMAYALKGRVGLASGNSLGYLTAGFANGKIEQSINTSTGATETLDETVNGLTFGVGLEHIFAPNLVGRVQVDATNFETTDLGAHSNGSTFANTSSTSGLNVGFTYQF